MKKLCMLFWGPLLVATCFVQSGELNARTRKTSFGATVTYNPRAVKAPALRRARTYTKKAAYAGFGKTSTTTGRIKTKSTRGYFKPSNGYKFVNPYARS